MHFQHKVTSSQQKQTMQLVSSQKQSAQQITLESLSGLDWMQVLWLGFEDYIKARNGSLWIPSILIGIFGGAMISSPVTGLKNVVIILVIFYVLLFTVNLLFYIYFAGRRIEKKIEEKSKKKQKRTQVH